MVDTQGELEKAKSRRSAGGFVPMVTGDPLLDTSEAAVYLGTSVRHVRRLIAGRFLPYYRVGVKTRLRRSHLDEFLAANMVDAADSGGRP